MALRARPSPTLWRNLDFVRLWAGETISLLVSELTALALPLTAALVLGASPTQMGVLVAAESAPYLVVGPPAGVWVDRVRRKPILIAANAARAALLLSIPALAAVERLTVEYLYVAAFVVGSFAVLFSAAYQSYLPTLVGRTHLIEGNSRLESSRAVVQTAGPGLAGLLIQWLSAPVAIVFDAATYVVSALCLRAIRAVEPTPGGGAGREGMIVAIRGGLRFVAANPLLRATTVSSAIFNAASGVGGAVYLLFVTREVGLGPGLLGLVFATGNVGPLLGAVLAGRVTGRCGVGPTIVWTGLAGGLGLLLVPLAGGGVGASFLLLSAANLLIGFADAIFVVTVVSLRQTVTPDRLQGRVNASVRSLADGMVPVGALLGGPLAEAVGLRGTLAIRAVGALFSVVWLWCSPVRTLRGLPSAEGVT